MSFHARVAALAAVMVLLSACEKRAGDPPVPRAEAARPVVPSATPDPSVPAAAAVLTAPTTPTAKDAASGRATGSLTAAQESSAMPMPGQVNNHSTTALDAVKRGASAP